MPATAVSLKAGEMSQQWPEQFGRRSRCRHAKMPPQIATPISRGLNIKRDLIIHGPAHRGANGAAMPTDENNQDGHFFYNHPERGGYFAA